MISSDGLILINKYLKTLEGYSDQASAIGLLLFNTKIITRIKNLIMYGTKDSYFKDRVVPEVIHFNLLYRPLGSIDTNHLLYRNLYKSKDFNIFFNKFKHIKIFFNGEIENSISKVKVSSFLELIIDNKIKFERCDINVIEAISQFLKFEKTFSNSNEIINYFMPKIDVDRINHKDIHESYSKDVVTYFL